ncbi:Golgi transport complex subunit 3 [Marasmius crinis-equi]|uniref:Conserved oligomeric Golgi complex subunit 3 n=1 Tax=Marasmius crinis-equi TaxID=585013 RepID=A0ABR3F676_9AGAR
MNVNPRRTGTPTLNAPPRSTQVPLSLEEWESKAPLEDLQSASILRIKKATEQPPFPLRFSNADSEAGASSRPSTPLIASKLQIASPASRPATPSRLKQVGLLPKHPILTPQQFYDWYTLIERSVAHSQDAHFRAHVSMVASHLETCDYLVEKVEGVEREVEGMLDGWKGVEEGGKSLKESCERVLEERDKILQLEQELFQRLEYFQELDHATRMLNHPGESLVLQSDFLYMVERVDICIDYLKSHRHFREAELYLLRFTQCLTRAMTLIKMYFVGSLRAMSSDIARRLSENKTLSQATAHHLLYTRFLSLSLRQPSTASNSHSPSSLPPLLRELERRAASHPETLEALLAECHAAYLSTRKALVGNVVREEVRALTRGVEMGSSNTVDVVELTRAGCSYIKQLCSDEFELFKEFFTTGEDQLYQYLETLCDYLYDDLRPRILHEPRLTALCEVCTVLQALMVLDVDVDAVGDSPPSSPTKRSKLHISQLLQMILQDAQTRLFFKAQAVVQSDIRHYVSAKEDLMYPGKLLASTRLGTNLDSEKASVPEADEDRETWYPTLRKTVWVLEQLHEFVNPAIFEDIAEEAILLCHGSLQAASDSILASVSNAASSSLPADLSPTIQSTLPLDSYLFLIRHLLILKEVPARFGLEPPDASSAKIKMEASAGSLTAFGFGRTESSVRSGVADTLTSLLSFAGADGGEKRTIDGTKRVLNQSIRLACESVISTCADKVCKPLRTWIDDVGPNSTTLLAGGSLAINEDNSSLPDLCTLFKQRCESHLRVAVGKIRVYLGARDVAKILTRHVLERIEEDYSWFRQVARGLKSDGKAGWNEMEMPMDESSLRLFLNVIEDRS